MRRALGFVGAGFVLLMLVADEPAQAKTSGFLFEGYLWPGQLVRDSVGLKDVLHFAALDDGPFHARAVADPDAGSWGPYAIEPETPGAYLGRVEIDDARATLSFRVPPLAPGRYGIRVCNSPCTTRLRRLEGYTFNIAANRTQAFLYEQLDHVSVEVSDTRFRLRKLREEVRALSMSDELAAEAFTDLSARTRRLQDRVRREDVQASSTGEATVVALMIVLGGALGFALGRQSLRRSHT